MLRFDPAGNSRRADRELLRPDGSVRGLLLGVGAEEVVGAVAAVFEDLVRTGGADEDAVMGEVELEGGAPGIGDFALVILFGAGGGEDDDLAFGLTGEGLGDLGGGSGGVMLEELLVLLEALDELVGVGIELGGFGINLRLHFVFHQEVAGSEQDERNGDYRNVSFHRDGVSDFSTGFLWARCLVAGAANPRSRN